MNCDQFATLLNFANNNLVMSFAFVTCNLPRGILFRSISNSISVSFIAFISKMSFINAWTSEIKYVFMKSSLSTFHNQRFLWQSCRATASYT